MISQRLLGTPRRQTDGPREPGVVLSAKKLTRSAPNKVLRAPLIQGRKTSTRIIGFAAQDTIELSRMAD